MKDIKWIVRIIDVKRISCGLILLTITSGVCALLLLFSINEAGKKEVLRGIKEEGDCHLLSLNPTFFSQSGKESGILSQQDISLLKNRVPQIEKIALWDSKDICKVKIGSREYPPEDATYVMSPIMSGVTPEFRKTMDLKLKEGRFINETDLIYKRRVCVIGGRLYERLGGGKIIGKTLVAKETSKDCIEEEVKFTIIGVFHKKIPLFASVPDRVFMSTAPFLFNVSNKSSDKIGAFHAFQRQQKVISNLAINDSIYIPWAVWMDFVKEKYSLSGSALPPYTVIPMKVKIPENIGEFVIDEECAIFSQETHSGCNDHDDSFFYYLPEKIKKVGNKIRKVLKERWGKDKIFVFSYDGTFADEIEIQARESNRLLMVTGIITLLLSGIILASIMLMSVHKRVQEIGIRRALGARKKDIFQQFLTEGVAIYSVGIVVGLLAGIVLSYLVIVKVLDWEYSMTWYSLVLSSVIPFVVGIISSLYPAMKAANIPPAIAVKYE